MTKGLALVVGATGSIGSALAEHLREQDAFEQVRAVSRTDVDITQEAEVNQLATEIRANALPLQLVFIATGALSRHGFEPEKSLKAITPEHLLKSFEINTLGPALLIKHLLPLFPKQDRALFAALSARVGSIGDNRLGGWYSYRASKAALNQLIHTASIELARRCPQAVCVALHPGTVAGPLSENFAKIGLNVQTPDVAAARLWQVLNGLTPEQSGGFFDYQGTEIPW